MCKEKGKIKTKHFSAKSHHHEPEWKKEIGEHYLI